MSYGQRVASLVPRDECRAATTAIIEPLRAALDRAAEDVAAELEAQFGGGSGRSLPLLRSCINVAHRRFVATLQESDILPTPLGGMQARYPREKWTPPDLVPATLDEARAAKTKIDRLHKELTLAERHRELIPVQEAQFVALNALELMKQALALETRDIVDKVAAAIGVDPAFVRAFPRHLERRALVRFSACLRELGTLGTESSIQGHTDDAPQPKN